MKVHLCMLFYILGCIFLVTVNTPVPVKIQTHSIAIPPLSPTFISFSPKTNHEENCLAEVIYHEGRGESIRTQVMIAEVTMNRVRDKSDLFPSSICRVVYQKRTPSVCQYSWVCGRHPIREERAWIRSKMLAQWLYKHYYLQRIIPDLTKGSLYFTTLETHRNWMNSMERQAESGNMKFLAAN